VASLCRHQNKEKVYQLMYECAYLYDGAISYFRWNHGIKQECVPTLVAVIIFYELSDVRMARNTSEVL